MNLYISKMFGIKVCFLVVLINGVASNDAIAECYDRQPIFGFGMNDSDRTKVTNLHNSYRLKVAKGKFPGLPKAINMRKLKYDEELEEMADYVAEFCDLEGFTIDSKERISQNIYTPTFNSDIPANWTMAVEEWAGEAKVFHYPSQSEHSQHFTLVIWAETSKIGCSFVNYQESVGVYRHIYICNYAIGGNAPGESVYKTGKGGCHNLCT